MATETKPAPAPSPARVVALMTSYIALSSVIAVVTDIGLAWAFARVQAIAERRAAPCGCEDLDEQLARLVDVDEQLAPYGQPHVRLMDVTTELRGEPIGEQLQADNPGGEA